MNHPDDPALVSSQNMGDQSATINILENERAEHSHFEKDTVMDSVAETNKQEFEPQRHFGMVLKSSNEPDEIASMTELVPSHLHSIDH